VVVVNAIGSRSSVVGIASTLHAWRSEVRKPVGARDCFLLQNAPDQL